MNYSKINRLVIVGNGFDLMHELKTSFYGFINYCAFEFLKTAFHDINDCESYAPLVIHYKSEFKKISDLYKNLPNNLKNNSKEFKYLHAQHDKLDRFLSYCNEPTDFDLSNNYDPNEEYLNCYNEIVNYVRVDRGLPFIPEYMDLVNGSILGNKLFTYIAERCTTQDWGGIESAYYTMLLHVSGIKPNDNLKSFIHSNKYDCNINGLNEEFEAIINYLEKYLTLIASDKKINEINEINELLSFLEKPISKNEVINSMSSKINNQQIPPILMRNMQLPELSETIKIKNTLFLNFNYTNTIKKYMDSGGYSEDKHIHIHGELNNPNNPIIFGYGDELDISYKDLENINDNRYLKYAKSMHYLNTGNYKKLLDFLDQNYYQIYIWGHSCSLSDRVLLNTLFEHENCISIKPFYHKKIDNTDNYTDLCTNISRSFTDKKLFRDVVVNKKYCKTLSSEKNN